MVRVRDEAHDLVENSHQQDTSFTQRPALMVDQDNCPARCMRESPDVYIPRFRLLRHSAQRYIVKESASLQRLFISDG